MDKLISLVSSLEAAIRYLLSGAVIATILVMSLNDPRTIFQWALSNQVPTALCVALIGFTAFSIYRLVLWVVFDFIAWKFNASAPAEFFVEGVSYAKPYAKFLRWRHSEDLPQSLSGYLTYRWSVAHFALVSLSVAAFGFWQISFLYRVEREQCRDRKPVAAAQEPN